MTSQPFPPLVDLQLSGWPLDAGAHASATIAPINGRVAAAARGMPLAFELIGRPIEEARVHKAAGAFQRETGWHRRRPPATTTSSRES